MQAVLHLPESENNMKTYPSPAHAFSRVYSLGQPYAWKSSSSLRLSHSGAISADASCYSRSGWRVKRYPAGCCASSLRPGPCPAHAHKTSRSLCKHRTSHIVGCMCASACRAGSGAVADTACSWCLVWLLLVTQRQRGSGRDACMSIAAITSPSTLFRRCQQE